MSALATEVRRAAEAGAAMLRDLPLSHAKACEEVGRLQHELRQFRAQYLGVGATPQPGCRIVTVYLDDTEVLAEIEVEQPEAPNHDADSRGAGPGTPGGVTIVNVLVNGKWIDPHGHIDDDVIQAWQERLWEDEAGRDGDDYPEEEADRERHLEAKYPEAA